MIVLKILCKAKLRQNESWDAMGIILIVICQCLHLKAHYKCHY